MKLKHKIYTLLISLLLILPLQTHADLARTASLGLILGESDWMIQDSGNIFHNPAYIYKYTGLLEVNSLDNTAADPYGSAYFGIGSLLQVGVTVGYQLITASSLNQFS